MLRLGLLLACIAAVGFAATPVEIIDATGKMKTVEELNQWAGRKIKSPGDRGKTTGREWESSHTSIVPFSPAHLYHCSLVSLLCIVSL